LVFAFLARRVVPGLNLVPRPTRAGLREVFGYGVFSFINQLIARAGTHLDRLLLGMFFGPAQVAWLAVPKDLLLRASGVTSSIGRVLFPRFSRMRQDGHMCDLFLTSTWCLLVVSLTCFVPAVVLMPRFLELWMGRDFARHASGPAQVLAAAFALTGAFAPYFSLLKGTDRMHWLTGIFLTTTGLGIAASLVLVPWLGLWGAALRYWVAIWCGFVVIAIITRKVFGASLRRRLVPTLWVPILLSIGLGGAMVWATGLLGPLGWIALLGSWAGMSALLASALWGCNRLQTGRDGPAAQVADALRRLLPGRRASRVLHPDLPSTARKETAA
jgi:O-antigen/teichoic acid export membrane protein